jgi:hypothetical protein
MLLLRGRCVCGTILRGISCTGNMTDYFNMCLFLVVLCSLATIRLAASAAETRITTVSCLSASATAEFAHVLQASVLSTAEMLTLRAVPGNLPDLQHEWHLEDTSTAKHTEQSLLDQDEAEAGAVLRVKCTTCKEKWYLVRRTDPTASHELVQRPITIQESPWCGTLAAFLNFEFCMLAMIMILMLSTRKCTFDVQRMLSDSSPCY